MGTRCQLRTAKYLYATGHYALPLFIHMHYTVALPYAYDSHVDTSGCYTVPVLIRTLPLGSLLPLAKWYKSGSEEKLNGALAMMTYRAPVP